MHTQTFKNYLQKIKKKCAKTESSKSFNKNKTNVCTHKSLKSGYKTFKSDYKQLKSAYKKF